MIKYKKKEINLAKLKAYIDANKQKNKTKEINNGKRNL